MADYDWATNEKGVAQVVEVDPTKIEEETQRRGSGVLDNIPEDVRRGSISKIFQLVAEDHQHEIKYRSMSWTKVAWLLAGDQVCLAIMAQTWSLSVLGWVPGILTMLGAGILFWITSMTMHRFIMKYPQIKDICDFAYYACGHSRIAYEFAGIMLLLNNIMLIGFHVWTGARIINTLSNHSLCTVVFSVIVTLIGIILSTARTLKHVSFMSMFSSCFMGLAILLFLVFVGIEKHPGYGYSGYFPTAGATVTTLVVPAKGTGFVACMNAVLNITFLWVPQILFPTFISEMERPQDFPKSLAVLAAMSAFLFIVPPAIGYHYLGQYSTAPAFGSLGTNTFIKASFAFVIVPTLVIGVIYANVTAKFIYFRIMGKSRHAHSNTVIGWGVWIGVMVVIWVIAFIFSEVIPSMGDFLSLLGAAFDSFFGFIFFAIAYWQLHRGQFFNGALRSVNSVVHIIVMGVGLFLLGPGLYAACEAIIAAYSAPGVTPAFTCSANSILLPGAPKYVY
ncbi:putative amino acid transporter [Neohortaea acidophila]|uniref:Putative amino acid transporter n=1 Tax=Neohortaea acidophila TaxID=245834 RepID=A0A6A6Q6X0_9PEZI|nr:putative amino acid transporter [Neohortaea acidophila]KAF2488130.1 putative amino acid transporter [Neohortaea acidophila]